MSSDLSLEFLRVVEQAAIACAHTMGQGDGHKSDQAAVETMRKVLDSVPIDGTIVIGEGERDAAPMLFIGEKVGQGAYGQMGLPEVDIAVDPLEGTNLCATGAPNAIAVLAAASKGGSRRQCGREYPAEGWTHGAGRRARVIRRQPGQAAGSIGYHQNSVRSHRRARSSPIPPSDRGPV